MKANSPLVSIVVPVYNVEAYLEKCIDSIVNQTYKNFEIFLVDDGSTDASSSICDAYAERDGRISVIHKKNGGLSDARNAGIEVARGDFILFVDSDDYIEVDTVDYLLGLALKNCAEIVVASHKIVYGDEQIKQRKNDLYDSVQVLTPIHAFNDALYGKKLSLHAWGKLYRRSLFNDVRFPKGRLYEDAGTTYKIIEKSQRVIVSSAKKYYYLQRRGSIINSGFYPRMMDSLYFANEMFNFAKDKQPESVEAARTYKFMCAVAMLDVIVASGSLLAYTAETTKCATVINQLKGTVLFNRDASKKVRLYALAAQLGVNSLIAVLKVKKTIKKAVRK